ncbi:T9SS type A sorting domain-containing protein [Rasiella sp. SM2506]|uniref:T9SS type A sorting domain-containing protein n=1 Tax=Rasiella sp. SM2506 TaxID=3423914 RepID=UPI003D7BBC88
MKHILLFLGITIGYHSFAQITLIPDEEFEMFLIFNAIDTDGTVNGQVNTADIEGVTELNIDQVPITDLTGIEDFAALEVLRINFTDLTSLNVSQNQNLVALDCQDNKLTELIMENNLALEELLCGNPTFDAGGANEFTSLDLSGAPNLKFLDTYANFQLVSLNLTQIPLLETFYGAYCQFDSLDFSNCPNLEALDIGGYEDGLIFGQSNNLTELDLSNNPNLTDVNVGFTGIILLNLQNGNNTILTEMRASLNDMLFCIVVDSPTAANNGDVPYGNWEVDPLVYYYDSDYCELGIEENELTSFTLSPNPTSQLVRITSSNNLAPKEIQIYSVSGQLLLEPSFNNGSIDISKLASGFYILKARFDTGFSSQPFIKE